MSDVSIKKETKEFFVFSYFNILPEKIFKEKEKTDRKSDYQAYVAYQCSYRAYRDVCRTIHYAYTSEDLKAKKKGWEDFENLKKAFIQYEINLIMEEIKSIPNTNDSFNNWHNNLCDYMLVDNDNFKEKLKIDTEVKQLFKPNEGDKEKNCFKYGMAQKWLNMTIKNILLVEDMFKGITEYDLEKI